MDMAIKIISEANPSDLSTYPPVRPEGGDIYLYYGGPNNEKKVSLNLFLYDIL